ncbi:MAG: hypothetical protein WA761_08065 [Thermoplasmata archaeon]
MEGALSFALVLVISTLVFAPGAHSGSAPHYRPVVLAGGTDSIAPVDRSGVNQSTFSVGYSQGVVCFAATDPLDTNATVQINDLNASRDGLTNPVSTWTIDLVGGSNNSTLWAGGSYLLPLTLTYGGEWNITIRGTNGGFDSVDFFVRTYSVQLFLSQSAYLPGHTGEAYYYVNATVNDAPYTQLSTVTATASYLTATSTVAPLADLVAALGTAPRGEFPFTVPTNANDFGDVDLELYANASGAGPVPNSASGLIAAPVGHLEMPRVTLGGCAFACSSSTFASGSPVFVSVVAMIDAPGISAPVGGMGLTIQFEKDNVPIPIGSVAGGPPSTITTNANGDAAVMFIATSPPFSLGSGNYVNVTLSDPLNSLNAVANGSASFALTTPQVTSPALGVAFVGSQFYGGNNATVTWQFGGLSTSNATGWIVDGWWVWSLGNEMLVQSGTIGSGSGKGSFQLTLPTGYVGELEVTVSAHNATASIVGVAYANASAPTIVLSVSDLAYYPGGSVSVTVATEGSALNGVPLYETVVGPSGLYLSNGPVINDRISFTIPTFGAPPSVTVTVTAQSALLGVIAQARQTIPEASGVALTLGVSTASQYSDGSYQPGQQVQIAYAIQYAGGPFAPPAFYTFVVNGLGQIDPGPGAQILTVTSPSGTFPYTIPSGTPSGVQILEVAVYLGSPASCNIGCTDGVMSINVNPNPSALGYELGSSGLTVAWLILLLLIVALALIGFVLWYRHRGGRPAPPIDREPVQPYIPPQAAAPESLPLPAPSGSSEPPPPLTPWTEDPSDVAVEPPELPGPPPPSAPPAATEGTG